MSIKGEHIDNSKWECYLLLIGFNYNNGYQVYLKMSPFEALYGRKWNIPVIWDNPTDKEVVGLELLKEMEDQMVKIKHNLKDSQDNKRIYVHKSITHREFKVGDHVFIKVKVKISSLKLGNYSNLATSYCGTFEILARLVIFHTCLHFLHPCAFIMYFMCLFFKCMLLMLII